MNEEVAMWKHIRHHITVPELGFVSASNVPWLEFHSVVRCWEWQHRWFRRPRRSGDDKLIPRLMIKGANGRVKAIYATRFIWELYWEFELPQQLRLYRDLAVCQNDRCVQPQHFKVLVNGEYFVTSRQAVTMIKRGDVPSKEGSLPPWTNTNPEYGPTQ